MICGIYKIICTKSEKIYIGSSINVESRFKVHKREFKKNKHNNDRLQNSWNKYGEDNFTFNLICTVVGKNDNKKSLHVVEKFYIDHYQSVDKGFNISKDPNGFTCEEAKEAGRRGGKKCMESLTHEQRFKRARKATSFLTPEQRSENGRKGGKKGNIVMNSKLSPEQRSERAKKVWVTRHLKKKKNL